MKWTALLSLALLAACDRPASSAQVTGDGGKLEQTAIARGVIADPAHLDPAGAYANGEDSLCVASGRIGVAIDLDESQRCTARGTITGTSTLKVALADACRFEATFDGDRITFPAILPDECDRSCTGRASLTALSVSRLSDSAVEAKAMRDGSGQPLCG